MSSPLKRALYILGTGIALVIIASCSTGCSRTLGVPVSAGPVSAQCDKLCYAPCLGPNDDTGIRWDGTPVDAGMWDKLAGVDDDSGDSVLKSLGGKLRQCEAARKACTKCLDNLEAQKVIVQ